MHPGSSASRGSLHRGDLHPRGGGWADTLLNGILRDTVNERAVRILLECILVFHIFFRCL